MSNLKVQDNTGNVVSQSEVRIAEIEQALDPNSTLPSVSLIADNTVQIGGTRRPIRTAIVHDGVQIGQCVLVTDYINQERFFHGIEIEPDYRGSGFGLAAYKAAIVEAVREGYTFRTEDWTQTDAARKIWDILFSRGIAREVQPFMRYQMDDGSFKNQGHYEVKP